MPGINMQERKRRPYTIMASLVSLICFSQVPSRVSMRMVHFKPFDRSENWEKAKAHCRKERLELAQIDTRVVLNSAKAKCLRPPSTKEFWTGLQYVNNRLEWSNGKEAFCNATLSEVIHCADLGNLTHQYCFLMTANQEKLKPSRCDIAHRFICQRVHISSECAHDLVPRGNCKEKPTAKSSQPTVPGTGHGNGLVETYLKNIRNLNASDTFSFQNAMNLTDALLKELKTTDEEMNVLIATKELEMFMSSFAKQHLTSVKNFIQDKRDEFIVYMKKIPSSTKDVVFSATWEPTQLDENDVVIQLPMGMFPKTGSYMTALLYNKMDQLLPLQAQASLDGEATKTGHIGSRVISITVHPRRKPFTGRVCITFRHLKSISPLYKPNCVFWNISMKSTISGSWSTEGCRVDNYSSSTTHCSCDHLTHFAVLMQVGEQKFSHNHQVALDIITYIGCALSLIGEAISIVAYAVFLNLKTNDTQIRFNFVTSIAVAQLIFILGIDSTQNKAICTAVAAAMHYFFLVAFCWMFTEGLLLYLNVVKVFNIHFRMWRVYGFAWGFPMIVVCLSILVATFSQNGVQGYVSGNFCWLSFSNGLVWSFVAPVIIITMFNILILARVMREVSTMPAPNNSENNKFKQMLKTCIVLFPLLGVTWVFGVLSITEPIGLACQYLFTICNSLQGFFIFVLHVARSSEFRAEVKRKFQRWESKRNPNICPALAIPTNGN